MLTIETRDQVVAIVNGRATPDRRFRQVVRLASGSCSVVEVRDIRSLDADPRTRVITCWAEDCADVVGVCGRALPDAAVVVWLPDAELDAYQVASEHSQVSALIGWPRDDPLPPIWQLACALQRLTNHQPRALSPQTPLRFNGLSRNWCPRTTRDLFAAVDDLGEVLEGFEIDQRTARRIRGVAHELLMNAMYGAPTDDRGRPKFARDRTQEISLTTSQAPSLTVATDGLTLSMQISDPFGGLRREHVYRSLIRGLGENASGSKEVIDCSGGGAGLGLHRIIWGASATAIDIVKSRLTNVTTTFDLGQSTRERRRAPKSLLYFQR